MQIASIKDFFEEIVNDLHTSLYLGLGGSIEEETFDWKSQAVELTSTGIKILILLAILGFFIGSRFIWLSKVEQKFG